MFSPYQALYAGQVGYIYCGVRSSRDVLVGDTLFHSEISPAEVKPYTEIVKVEPTVYAGLFPIDTDEYDTLKVWKRFQFQSIGPNIKN